MKLNKPRPKGRGISIKMLKMPSMLGTSNIMLNSFHSCISNTPKELARTPEMPFSEIFSEPGMFSEKFKSCIAFKELECLTDRNCWRQFNKKMDMVDSNMQFINSAPISPSCCIEKPLAVNFSPIKLEGIHGIFNFPDKMESILSKGMFKMFQIHFFPPKSTQEEKAHANFVCLFQEGKIYPLHAYESRNK